MLLGDTHRIQSAKLQILKAKRRAQEERQRQAAPGAPRIHAKNEANTSRPHREAAWPSTPKRQKRTHQRRGRSPAQQLRCNRPPGRRLRLGLVGGPGARRARRTNERSETGGASPPRSPPRGSASRIHERGALPLAVKAAARPLRGAVLAMLASLRCGSAWLRAAP